MSSSIFLYRVPGNITSNTLDSSEIIFDRSKSVNLYKIAEHLAVVFLNTVDPFGDVNAIPYKALYGNFVNIQKGDRVINGFIPTDEVNNIYVWMKENNLKSSDGFYKMFEGLTPMAKQELHERGSDDKESLYTGYVQPLIQFYSDAKENNNAVVLCGE